MSLFVVAAVLGLVPLAAPALAAPAAVTGNLDTVPDVAQPPGRTAEFSFTIGAESRTLRTFKLTPPNGYQLGTIDALSSGTLVPGTSVEVNNLAVSGTETFTVTFEAKTSCVGGSHGWLLVAKDNQNRTYANSAASDLVTSVGGDCELVVQNDPKDTKAGELITDGDRIASLPISVKLVDDLGNAVTHFPLLVTFDLGSDPSGGAATLDVTPETTNAAGVATFDSLLEIDLANVAEFTDYTLVPRGVGTPITGDPSAGFDIWEDATSCSGPNCTLSHDGDEYLVPGGQAGKLLSASTFTTDESNINCAGYTEITGDVVWHEYTGTAAVLVKIHITRAEMKASANNGQALVKVCVGLLDEVVNNVLITGEEKWANLGVVADHQDSDGDTVDDIWVALAPTCPNQSPDQFAPCVARQYGDGAGGSWTEVWIPGGDPPRRT